MARRMRVRVKTGQFAVRRRRPKARAGTVAVPKPTWPPGIGHNQGPPLDEPTPPWRGGDLATYFAWEAACDAAWEQPPYEIVMLRLRRAESLGMTYRQYTLEIMERGRYLQPGDLD